MRNAELGMMVRRIIFGSAASLKGYDSEDFLFLTYHE